MKIRLLCPLFVAAVLIVPLSAQATGRFSPFRPMFGLGISGGAFGLGPHVMSFRSHGRSMGRMGAYRPRSFDRGFHGSRKPQRSLPVIGGASPWFFSWGGGVYGPSRNHGSADFVEYWLDREPGAQRTETREASHEYGLARSPLLKEGMDPETVLRLLGSPVRRNRFGTNEFWRYSGYTLTFDAGRLVDIR